MPELEPEPYDVVLSASVKRGLAERLPLAAASAAVEFIYGPLAHKPHRVGALLRAPFEGYYRARRGEYRVRYRIDDVGHTVYVVDVDHRRDTYHT